MTELNLLSARLDALKLQLAAGLANGTRSLSVKDAVEIFEELTQVSTRLRALAADLLSAPSTRCKHVLHPN